MLSRAKNYYNTVAINYETSLTTA